MLKPFRTHKPYILQKRIQSKGPGCNNACINVGNRGTNDLQDCFTGQHDQGKFGATYFYLEKLVKIGLWTERSHSLIGYNSYTNQC